MPFSPRRLSRTQLKRTRGEVTPQTPAGPEQALYAFQGGNDGLSPSGGLIFDSSGNLYGMTEFGGTGTCTGNTFSGCGTVFKLSPNGSGGWVETVLYSFQGGSDGEEPSSGLIFDQAGNLYGTTTQGGGQSACTNGCGTVFRLAPNGSGGWVETILYSFGTNGGASDGARPQGVILDKSGNLFGTTFGGGILGCNGGFLYCGTVFELSPNGSGGWTETLPSLLNFPSGGALPNPGLTDDQSGNLYGTTYEGGGSPECQLGCGIVFELSPNGSGGWTGKTLYSFQGQSDGALPFAGVVFDQSGNFYGATRNGGGSTNTNCASGDSDGCGTVYKLSPNGSGGWTETTLYAFQGGNDGQGPTDSLIFDQSGNLFSTTRDGGESTNCITGSLGCGTVFELSPNGSGGWTESILYSFQAENDGDAGNSSTGGVIRDQAGNLYGTTPLGGGTGCGSFGCGTVYEVFFEPFGTFSPGSLGFGNQIAGVSSSPLVLTFTNSGQVALTVTSVQVTGANSGDFSQTNNCPSTLAPHASCEIDVTFTPTAGGNRTAAISVTDSAPSSPQTLPVSGIGQDFSLAPTSPLTATVIPGQPASYTVAVSPAGGFSQTVMLTCSGVPAEVVCTLNPSSVTFSSSNPVPVTVLVVTAGTSAGLSYPDGFTRTAARFALWIGFAGLSGLVLLGSRARKQHGRMLYSFALLCLLSVAVTSSGCTSNGKSNSGTPAGTYNLTVTGTSSTGSANLTHSTTLTLVVQ